MVRAMADLFDDQPLVLTDRLLNTIYFSPAAEELFRDRGEAIVNRALFSILGLDDRNHIPPRMVEALSGKAGPWKAVMNLPGRPAPWVCEASCVRDGEMLLCGVVRLRESAVARGTT